MNVVESVQSVHFMLQIHSKRFVEEVDQINKKYQKCLVAETDEQEG